MVLVREEWFLFRDGVRHMLNYTGTMQDPNNQAKKNSDKKWKDVDLRLTKLQGPMLDHSPYDCNFQKQLAYFQYSSDQLTHLWRPHSLFDDIQQFYSAYHEDRSQHYKHSTRQFPIYEKTF